MPKKIIITGATGLIGKNLSGALILRGDEVFVFSRDINKAKKTIPGAKRYIVWDINKPGKWNEHINNKDAIIHLAGTNIFGRWTDKYKKKILLSRELSTKSLAEAIGSATNKPSVFICASGINFYGDSADKILTEDDSEGNDFLAKVCFIWEKTASNVEAYNVRRVSIRTAPALTPEGGALKQMLPAFRFFLGGPLGSGKQYFPWVHIDDLINIYLYAIDNPNIKGPINTAAPCSVTMNEFADVLGKVLHRPSFFRVPKFLMRIAVGEVAEIVTASIRARPQKLLENGFKFKFENLEDALNDLLKTGKTN